MYETCWLHIGTEKTGTTALQSHLAKNRKRLRHQGFAYSKCLGINHLGLVGVAIDPSRLDRSPLSLDLKTAAAQRDYLRKITTRLRWETFVNTRLRRARTLIVSSELCHGRLWLDSEVERLRQFLLGFAGEVKVLVYLRPQHEVAVSRYSTFLRDGFADPPLLPELAWPNPYYDYESLLDRWARSFGAANVVPRIYDKATAITDAVQQLGVAAAGWKPALEHNTPLTLEQQAFLLHFNRHLKHRNRRFFRKLWGIGATPGAAPARRDVEATVAFFAESNERLRRRWFPERSRLFDIDVSHYPQNAVLPGITIDEAFAIFATAWTRRANR